MNAPGVHPGLIGQKHPGFTLHTDRFSGTLELGAFFNELVANGHLPDDHYLTHVELGKEVMNGARALCLDSLEITGRSCRCDASRRRDIAALGTRGRGHGLHAGATERSRTGGVTSGTARSGGATVRQTSERRYGTNRQPAAVQVRSGDPEQGPPWKPILRSTFRTERSNGRSGVSRSHSMSNS